MNKIEKLYENAGIKPTYYDACTVEDKYWQDEELANKYGTFDMYMNAKCGNQENCSTLCSCAYTKEEYPPFTAEKQLKIIINFDYFEMRFENWEYLLFASNNEEHRYHAHDKIFKVAFAKLINTLWQDLTAEEKQQIKEILE